MTLKDYKDCLAPLLPLLKNVDVSSLLSLASNFSGKDLTKIVSNLASKNNNKALDTNLLQSALGSIIGDKLGLPSNDSSLLGAVGKYSDVISGAYKLSQGNAGGLLSKAFSLFGKKA